MTRYAAILMGRRLVMRHDPAGAAVVIMLRSLKMHGMAQAANDLMEQGSPAFDAAIPILSQLLKAETAEREVRSVAYQIKAARFPVYKDLTGFDFASSEVNETLVRQLHRCEFTEKAENIVLVDPRRVGADWARRGHLLVTILVTEAGTKGLSAFRAISSLPFSSITSTSA
jgi:hypothetical protein